MHFLLTLFLVLSPGLVFADKEENLKEISYLDLVNQIRLGASVKDLEKFHLDVTNDKGEPVISWFIKEGDFQGIELLVNDLGIDMSVKDNKGGSLLHHVSSFSSHPDVILFFINEQTLNSQDNEGYTPLHYAVLRDRFLAAEILIGAGASFDIKDNQGRTALELAQKINNKAMERFLKESYDIDQYIGLMEFMEQNPTVEDVMNSGLSLEARNEWGKTVLQTLAKQGDIQNIKTLLEAGADVSRVNKNGKNILHLSSDSKNHEELVRLVASYNKNLLNQTDNQGQTPFHRILPKKNERIIRTYIENGADPFLLSPQGQTAFEVIESWNEKKWNDFSQEIQTMLASKEEKKKQSWVIDKVMSLKKEGEEKKTEEVVEISSPELSVENKVEMDEVDEKGNSRFHILVKEKNLEEIKKLIELGVSKDVSNYEGMKVFHLVALSRNLEIMKLFLNENNVNERNSQGETPLHLSVISGSEEAVNFVLNLGANLLSIDNNEETPLDLAFLWKHEKLVSILKDRLIEYKNDLGQNALHVAVLRRDFKKAQELMKESSDRKKVLNEQDSLGQTPVYLAAKIGDMKMLKYLMKLGARMDVKSHEGLSPMSVARKENHTDIIMFLDPANKALMKHRDEKGNSNEESSSSVNSLGENPLHWIARFGYLEGLKPYFKKVSMSHQEKDILNVQDQWGQTALYLAAERGDKDIVKALLELNADYHISNHEGKAPIQIAREQRYIDIVKIIENQNPEENLDVKKILTHLEKGLKKNQFSNWEIFDMSLTGLHSSTPLHVLGLYGRTEDIYFFSENMKYDEEVAFKVDDRGNTFLFYMAPRVQIGAVKPFLKKIKNKKLFLNIKNKQGETVLHKIVTGGAVNSVRYFLELGANPLITDKKGRKPIDRAREKANNPKIIQLLKEAESKINCGKNF